jgi:hypothetical protein
MRKGTSKAGGNKSQLIRDFAAANPTMKVSDIVKTLTEQGHKVYPAIVSQALRGSTGAKKPKAKRGRKPGTKNAVKTTSTEFNLTNIKAAAAFVKATGGVDAAITSIKSFEKMWPENREHFLSNILDNPGTSQIVRWSIFWRLCCTTMNRPCSPLWNWHWQTACRRKPMC